MSNVSSQLKNNFKRMENVTFRPFLTAEVQFKMKKKNMFIIYY